MAKKEFFSLSDIKKRKHSRSFSGKNLISSQNSHATTNVCERNLSQGIECFLLDVKGFLAKLTFNLLNCFDYKVNVMMEKRHS